MQKNKYCINILRTESIKMYILFLLRASHLNAFLISIKH